jgi:non-specific serine/threonine protein kinase
MLAVTLVPDHRMALDAALARARADLGEVAYAAAWIEGDAMSTDQAVAYALDASQAQEVAGDRALSPRERQVARLVARGLTNRQLANELVISTRTADHHVASILAKLGLDTRAQIAGWVERIGMRDG